VTDGIYNIVIGCPHGVWRNDRVEGEPRELASFYAELLGMRIIRDDWIKIAHDPATTPQLAFGGDGWSDDRPPRWGDPDHPQQVHLDVFAGDVDRTADLVTKNGATLLHDDTDHRVYADPFGHPFCVYRADDPGAPPAVGRVVFDCADPPALAAFYEGLFGRADPMLAFQRSDAPPPTWPDPAYPAQIHLDLRFTDAAAARRRAEDLGARLLPPQGGSCPVYADPAGHPFCLCAPGE
jgi:hypothetical protein